MKKTAIILALSIIAIMTSCDPPRFMLMTDSKAKIDNMEAHPFYILEETEDKIIYLTELVRLVQKVGDEKLSYASGDELFLRYETLSKLKNDENQNTKVSAILHCMPERIATREGGSYDTYAFEVLYLTKSFYKNGETDEHAELNRKWVNAGLSSDNGLPSKIVDYYFNNREKVPVHQENLIGLEQNGVKNGVYELSVTDSVFIGKIKSMTHRTLIVKNDIAFYKTANSSGTPASMEGITGDYHLNLEMTSNNSYKAKNVDIELNITTSDDNTIEVEVVSGYITHFYSGGQYLERKEILPVEKQTLSFVRELTTEDEESLLKNKLYLTHDEGVIINGVRWATRNVDAPGRFADKPEDAGMFYQWNRKESWPAIGDLLGIDYYKPNYTEWEKANDPSPVGWRVPTLENIQSLLDTAKVTNEWTTQNGVKGQKFTDKTTGNSIFLPAIGYRDVNGGASSVYWTGMTGFYWSSTPRENDNRNDGYKYLTFDNRGVQSSAGYGINMFTVRPIAMIISAEIFEYDPMDGGEDIKVLETNPYTWGKEENIFKEIPEFLQSIEGRYRNTDETNCKLVLDITKRESAFWYELQIEDELYDGFVTFHIDGDDSYMTLEGIPWKDNAGALDSDGEPVEPDIEPAYGIDLFWNDGKLTFMNYGNSMNYFVKTNCTDKFIMLIKV